MSAAATDKKELNRRGTMSGGRRVEERERGREGAKISQRAALKEARWTDADAT